MFASEALRPEEEPWEQSYWGPNVTPSLPKNIAELLGGFNITEKNYESIMVNMNQSWSIWVSYSELW